MAAEQTDIPATGQSFVAENNSDWQALPWRVWACFGMVLFAITWKLWTPQNVFPQVPLFEFAASLPPLLDWVAFAGVIIALLVCVIKPAGLEAKRCWPVWLFISSLVVLFSLDQHRLQPWAWHWLVFAVLLMLANRGDAIRWLRWIVISIYVYSAISKLDYQFTHSVGLEMLQTLAGLVGVSLVDYSPDSLSRFVLLLPLAELLTGIGLIFGSTRPLFGWLAIGLHFGLLLVLGPLGLNHQSPVLIWNAFFIFQAYWLFVRRETRERSLSRGSLSGERQREAPGASECTRTRFLVNWLSLRACALNWSAAAFALVVMLFPATCSFGGCDHWLAWELYAPRSSRVTVELPASAVAQLPYPVENYQKESLRLPGVVELALSDWSLGQLGVPVYPQARFQLGVARAINEQLNNDRMLRTTVESRSDRWTGQRSSQSVFGGRALEDQASKFWLNTVPRSLEPKFVSSPVD